MFAEAVSGRLPESETRGLVFGSLVTCNLLLIFVNRSFSSSIVIAFRRPNAALWVVLAATTVLLAVSLDLPSVRTLFVFGPMGEGPHPRLGRWSRDRRATRIDKSDSVFEKIRSNVRQIFRCSDMLSQVLNTTISFLRESV